MNKGVAVAVADDPTQVGSRVDLLDIRSAQTPPSLEGSRVADHRRKEDDHEGGVLDARSCLVQHAGGDGVVGPGPTIYELDQESGDL